MRKKRTTSELHCIRRRQLIPCKLSSLSSTTIGKKTFSVCSSCFKTFHNFGYRSTYFFVFLLILYSFLSFLALIPLQKQPPEAFIKNKCPWKFRKIFRKTSVPASLFKWICRPEVCIFILFKKRLWHSCFPVNFSKFLRAPFW